MNKNNIFCLTILFFALFVAIFSIKNPIQANEKYTTIVNPVRSRELWQDKSLQPLIDQYQIINHLKLKATWLIQSDVLQDQLLIEKFKEFNQDQEFGIFLEVSKNLATKSRVYYPTETTWYSPKAVFLSAYNPNDRKKILDQLISDFKNTFGYFPKSAGAWWIDSYSQQYLENKYHLNTVMIVADQKSTDNYGVWGQWWGYPYFPSVENVLVPGNSKTVVIQWAQRDLVKAYKGSGPSVSNYSLQANDYTSQGLDIKYFQNLAGQYLSTQPLGQITVGLETGMESVGNETEYNKQLKWISENQVVSLKMSEFGDKYRQIYKNKNPDKIVLANWVLTPEYRNNLILGEKIVYNPNLSFSDKFIADKSEFLDRILPNLTNRKEIKYWPFFLLLIPILCWWSKSLMPILWVIILYLPVFRSYYSSGWKIFFGPTLNDLILTQALVLLVGGILITKINQKLKIHRSSWWSIWIINLLIFNIRYSVIEGQHYFGWLIDNFRFVGLSIGDGVKFLNQDLIGFVAVSMLKFNLSWIWNSWWVWIIAYPIVEIGLVFLINKLIPKKFRYIMSIMSILFVVYIFRLSPLAIK